ncbi:hypothetical protein JNUCC23_09595 [Peribacillus sp. JNUCC 23]
MKIKKLRNLSKITLAGAIALSGLSILQLSEVPGFKVESASAAFEDISSVTGTYSSSGKDSLKSVFTVTGSSELGFISQRFTLQNSVGTIVKTGSLNSFIVNGYTGGDTSFQSVTNISTAGLPAGHYRINLTAHVDDNRTVLDSSQFSTLTGAFTIDSSRNLVNFRQ